MSAEFLPLYRLCGTSISSMAHSWKGRLYSVNRFQSAYARRTMILPFSSSRSSTSFSSNCLYWASWTPRAMFSKSMNIASFRSPFIRLDPFRRGRCGPPEYYKAHGDAHPAGPDAHDEMAGPHLRPDTALRPRAVDLPVLRRRRRGRPMDVGGIPRAAASDDHVGRSLRHALVQVRQPLGRRPRQGDHEPHPPQARSE